MTYEQAQWAAKQPGFTYEPALDTFLIPGEDRGYCVGLMYDAVQLKNEMASNFDQLAAAIYTFANTNSSYAVGGWYDHDTGVYHLDKVQYSGNLHSALAIARDNCQKAIFDLGAAKEIYLEPEVLHGDAE